MKYLVNGDMAEVKIGGQTARCLRLKKVSFLGVARETVLKTFHQSPMGSIVTSP